MALQFVLAEDEEYGGNEIAKPTYERHNGPKNLVVIAGIGHYDVYGTAWQQFAGLCVQRVNVSFSAADTHNDLILDRQRCHGDGTSQIHIAHFYVPWWFSVDPVQRRHIIGALDHIRDAIDDDWIGLPGSGYLITQQPLELKWLHVFFIELFQQAMSLTRITTVVSQPVARFIGCVADTLVTYFSDRSCSVESISCTV